MCRRDHRSPRFLGVFLQALTVALCVGEGEGAMSRVIAVGLPTSAAVRLTHAVSA